MDQWERGMDGIAVRQNEQLMKTNKKRKWKNDRGNGWKWKEWKEFNENGLTGGNGWKKKKWKEFNEKKITPVGDDHVRDGVNPCGD